MVTTLEGEEEEGKKGQRQLKINTAPPYLSLLQGLGVSLALFITAILLKVVRGGHEGGN